MIYLNSPDKYVSVIDIMGTIHILRIDTIQSVVRTRGFDQTKLPEQYQGEVLTGISVVWPNGRENTVVTADHVDAGPEPADESTGVNTFNHSHADDDVPTEIDNV